MTSEHTAQSRHQLQLKLPVLSAVLTRGRFHRRRCTGDVQRSAIVLVPVIKIHIWNYSHKDIVFRSGRLQSQKSLMFLQNFNAFYHYGTKVQWILPKTKNHDGQLRTGYRHVWCIEFIFCSYRLYSFFFSQTINFFSFWTMTVLRRPSNLSGIVYCCNNSRLYIDK